MAGVKPENREITVAYKGGTVSAVYGLIKYLFPSVTFKWRKPTGTTPKGRRKSYASRRVSNSEAGQPIMIKMASGEVWWVRITGTPLDFINALLADNPDERFYGVYTKRGTNFLPEAVLDLNGILPGTGNEQPEMAEA
jgi:hypothetical protein